MLNRSAILTAAWKAYRIARQGRFAVGDESGKLRFLPELFARALRGAWASAKRAAIIAASAVEAEAKRRADLEAAMAADPIRSMGAAAIRNELAVMQYTDCATDWDRHRRPNVALFRLSTGEAPANQRLTKVVPAGGCLPGPAQPQPFGGLTMDNDHNITRRAVLKGAPAATAALAISTAAVAVAEPAGFPPATAHARALAEVMANADFFEGWSVRIHGGDPEQSIWFGNAHSIEQLIEAHRAAWRLFADYCDVHEAAQDAYKPERALVPMYLTPDGRAPAGFYELNPDYPSAALKAIRDHHEATRRTHCGMLANAVLPAEQVKATAKAIKASERRCLKALDCALEQEDVDREASGFGAVEREYEVRNDAEDAALVALCASPCKSRPRGGLRRHTCAHSLPRAALPKSSTSRRCLPPSKQNEPASASETMRGARCPSFIA